MPEPMGLIGRAKGYLPPQYFHNTSRYAPFLDVGMSEKTKSAVLSCYVCDRRSDGTP